MQKEKSAQLKIAVAVPCYNEERTIAKVISDFHAQLPEADIVVFDNDSSDNTAKVARKNGATVFFEKRRGKGCVLQRIFRVMRSDILIIVDGDDTYAAEEVHELLSPIRRDEADMVVGNRLFHGEKGFSPAHRFGNAVFRYSLNYLFRTRYTDILSGYRAMQKSFYKNLPLLSKGFEIETELTLQSLERGYRVKEVPIHYRNRPYGSHSKIRKFKDGSRIILTIISLLRDYRPMTFFAYLGSFFMIAGMFFGSIVVREYFQTGIIQRVPSAILSIALIIVGVNAVISGLILSAVNRRHREMEMIVRQIGDNAR